MKSSFFLFLLMFLFYAEVSAQAAYRGEAGDGYGMTELLMLPQVHVHDVQNIILSVYPNPAKTGDIVWIQQPLKNLVNAEVCIISAEGKKVFCQFVSHDTPEKFPVSTATLPAGFYSLHFTHSEFNYVSKLIIIDYKSGI